MLTCVQFWQKKMFQKVVIILTKNWLSPFTIMLAISKPVYKCIHSLSSNPNREEQKAKPTVDKI